MEANEDKRHFEMTDLVPNSWRQTQEFQTVLFSLYPTGIRLNSDEANLLLTLGPLARTLVRHPVSFAFIKMESVKARSANAQIFYDDGQRYVSTDFGEKEIPSGSYLAIFSPVISNDTGSVEGPARDAIATCRGLVVSALGHCAADALAHSFECHLHEVKTSVAAPLIENFIPTSEYPFFNSAEIKKLCEAASKHLPSDRRQRLETALLFVGNAAAVVDSTLRFINSWIALEVACGSRGQAEKIMKLTLKVGADDVFARLKASRDDLFHTGKRCLFSAEDERAVHAALFNVLADYYRLPTAKVGKVEVK